ncbi:fl(2)d-associated complex component-like [Anopheles ziemanni]|uniref:fl(2)d-associated complex component-like n=1 Tax=Anopheles ziemanni TaxID=345580 RepID=UPI00265F2E5F|nr:fl(2)d-associated complex component-like [Anopheles ziemanni]
MSTPIKRKITLELASKKSTLIKDRPSVFQRLGTKKIIRPGSTQQQQQQQQHQYISQEGESKEEIVKRIVSAAEEPKPSTSGNPVLESVAAHARLIQAQLAAKQLQVNKSLGATGSSGNEEAIASATGHTSSVGATEQRGDYYHSQVKVAHSHHQHHHHHHHHHHQQQQQQGHSYQKYHQHQHHRHPEEEQQHQQHQRLSRDRVHSLSSDRSSIGEPEAEVRVSRRARGATGWDESSLENADQDILERKRKELQHELKLEMDSSSSKKQKDGRGGGGELSKKLKKMSGGGSGGVSSHHRSQHHQPQQHSSHHQHSLQQQQQRGDIGHGHGHGGHGHGQMQLPQHHTSSSTTESTSSSGSESSESDTSSSTSSSSHDSNHRRLKKRGHAVSGRARRGDSSSSSGTVVATATVGTVSSAGSSGKLSKKHAKKLAAAAAAAAASQEQSERSKRMAKAKGGGGGSGNGSGSLLTKTIRVKRLHPGSPNGGSGGSGSTHHVSRKVSRELSSSSSLKYTIAKAKLHSSSSSSSAKKEKISALVARERVRVKERELALREKERELVLREKEREREKERLRLREREVRERLGKMRPASPPRMRAVAVSPVSSRGGGSLQGKGKKSPERRLSSPLSSSRYREMVPMRRERTPELARDERRRSHESLKERERRVREVMRSKERDDVLVRCGDRPRERDRLSVKEQHQQQQQQQQHQHMQSQARNLRRDNDGGLEKPDRHRPVERLLPRPAERARALAAARSPGKSVDRDRSRSPGSPGRRGGLRDRERSYERSAYLHELHERRTSSRSRERDYVSAHGPPPSMRTSRRDSPPPHYDVRHGPVTGRDSSGGGGMRMDYRAERDELAYVDSRMGGPMGGSGRGERGVGGGRDEYGVRDYPDDPPPRREQHHERPWDSDWNERGGDAHGPIDTDGPYMGGGGGGGGRGGDPRGAWEDRPSWKDGPGEPWHSEREMPPERGMQVDWKYKERQWEHEHGVERGGLPTGGGGGAGGGGHGHGGHGLGGHGGGPPGPASRRSWQQSNSGGGGGPGGGGSGGPAGDWLGPKGEHERDFMPHQRPNDRPMFRRHHHQGPYHGHPRKPHLGAGGGGGGGGTGGGGGSGLGGSNGNAPPGHGVGGQGGMSRFQPNNKYSLNRTQANLQAAERNAPGGVGSAGGLGNHGPQSHRQTPPVSGGSIGMQPPSAAGGHHHGSHGHSPAHNSGAGNPGMQQQGARHEPHPHSDTHGHSQHHHQHQQQQQQQQFAPHQPQPSGTVSAAPPQPQQTRDRAYDEGILKQQQSPATAVAAAAAGTGTDQTTVQRRPTPLDAPASPTPDTDASFNATPSIGIPPVSSPSTLVASSPLANGADPAAASLGPVTSLISMDSMEVDNLSEISDDADEILMREEELGTNQLCESLSTGSISLLGQEPELDQSATVVASVSSISSQPSAYGPEADGGSSVAPEADVGVGGTVPPAAVALATAGSGEMTVGTAADVPSEGYGEAEQTQVGRDAGKLHANKELKEEMDLDFEEISDGELEAEENRGKAGLGDPLGVDWGSLTTEVLHPLKHPGHRQHTHQFPVSARNRWKAHHILLDIGISVRLAGASYAHRVLTEAKERLREELEEFHSVAAAARTALYHRGATEKHTAPKAESDSREDGTGRGKTEEETDAIKTESPEHTGDEPGQSPPESLPTESKVEPQQQQNQQQQNPTPDAASISSLVSNIEQDVEEMDRILHPVAAVHVARRERARLRRNLILASEPVAGQQRQCGRALSARKDLQIRRQLCGYPPITMATMTACAAGAATGFLHQELLADAPLGRGGGTARPELREEIRQMYLKMVAEERQTQQLLGISATLPAILN